MLETMKTKKRIINVDETWLADTQFSRRKWRQHGTTNSQAAKQVKPRISMILSFDSEGEVYFALTQVNTNADIMKMFLSQLASRLDVDRPNWRKNSVVLLDGATYHTSNEVRLHMLHLRMPVMFTAPSSYDACPVEKFFAYLKNQDINPLMLPTGKR